MKELLLIVHFVGLAMGLGTSLGFMFLGMASAKMEKGEAQKFMLNASAMSKMGYIGLVILVTSGVFLMAPYWELLPDAPLLIAKLVLVIVLSGLIGTASVISGKAKQGDTEYHMKRMEPIGKLTLVTALVIVVLAVLYFK